MTSTRRMEIFHDPLSSFENDLSFQPSYGLAVLNPEMSQTPIELSLIKNPTFHSSIAPPSARSPLKAVGQGHASLPKRHFDANHRITFSPPQDAPFITDSPSKKTPVSIFQPIAPQKSHKPIYTSFAGNGLINKENFNPTYHSDNFAEFPDPIPGLKLPIKRALQEAAPLQDRPCKKPKLEPRRDQHSEPRSEEPAMAQIPEPQDMPVIDDTGAKPPYSYASLIGMSILRAPARRLTLAQIYKWISDTFSYYRASDAGWQNSIRHNLSLNKAFIKQERPKDDPGKGNYWAIEPGMELLFTKDKLSRRPSSYPVPSLSSGPSMRIFSQPSNEANVSTWPIDAALKLKPTIQKSGVQEPSSDATIPASDAPSHEDEIDETRNMPPPSSRLPRSSPPRMIHSSPPMALHSQNNGTSPAAVDAPLPSSRSTSTKRKLAAMDDSGYFSSLDSSVTRPYDAGKVPFSEINMDRKRIKHGRAEEEIARIRSSSHDISPTKGRSILKQPNADLISSSPTRHFDTSAMLPPLTPAVTFKIPQKPPASISPNTNLRNHRNKIRELVGSPVKSPGLLNDEISFSPAFNIVDEENSTLNTDFGPHFDIFVDHSEHGEFRHSSASPMKRSIRRPRLERASKSTNILADVTGTNLNSKSFRSTFNSPLLESPIRQKKDKSQTAFDLNDLVDLQKEDLFGLDLFVDDEPDDFGGLDLLQGFQKIGGNNKNPPLSAKKTSRPLLGPRHNTSRV